MVGKQGTPAMLPNVSVRRVVARVALGVRALCPSECPEPPARGGVPRSTGLGHLRESFWGAFQAPFPPPVARRLLLSPVGAAIA